MFKKNPDKTTIDLLILARYRDRTVTNLWPFVLYSIPSTGQRPSPFTVHRSAFSVHRWTLPRERWKVTDAHKPNLARVLGKT